MGGLPGGCLGPDPGGRLGGLTGGCLGPDPGGGWGVWPGVCVSRPTPSRVAQTHTWGVSRPRPRGVYPNMF